MKVFKNKLLVKFVAVLCIFLTLINLGLTTHTYAAESEEEKEVFGGVLLVPVLNLLTGIADGIMDILHSGVLEQTETLIRLEGSKTWWEKHGAKVLGWIAAIVVITVVIGATIATGGAASFAGAGVFAKMMGACFIIKTGATALATGIVSGVLVAKVVDSSMMEEDLYLPIFKLTPEEIFANEILMFDINFFNPKPSQEINVKTGDYETGEKKLGEVKAYTTENYSNVTDTNFYDGVDGTTNIYYKQKEITNPEEDPWVKITDEFFSLYDITGTTLSNIYNFISESSTKTELENIIGEVKKGYKSATTRELNTENCTAFVVRKEAQNMGNYSEGGGVLQLYCNGTDEAVIIVFYFANEKIETINKITLESTAAKLKQIISKWYFLLRNLALLVLMLVLVYSGIRIVLGSTAGEKAKYKERAIDWLVAMCLLFVMHYLMFFAVELTESIIKMVDLADGTDAVIREIHLENEKHIQQVQENSFLNEKILPSGEGTYLAQEGFENETFLEWGTDLMGGMRIDLQLVNEGTLNWTGYVLCYLVLAIYTLIFSWTYLRRVLYMAFLTIISPLVAMTYPIDKITDGKAQAFNAWLKEYIFNLLLQPFHLLLYLILVGSAYELAGKNPIYAVVAIGFMTPAEKLLRKFFGFDKAQTPGLLGGAAGAALAMTGMKSMMKFGAKNKGRENTEDANSNDSGKIKFSSSEGVNAKAVVANGRRMPSDSEMEDNDSEAKNTEENTPAIIRTQGTNGNLANTQKEIYASQAQQTPPHNIRTAIPTTQSPAPKRRIYARTGSTAQRKAQRSEKSAEWLNNMREKLPDMPSGLKTTGRVAGGMVGGYFRALGKKNYKRINKMRPIRSLARGVAGAAGAATFGMAGLALGIASGDPSKAFQYATAGIAGGYGAGKGLGGAAVDALSVDTNQLKDEMEMDYYGEDYKKVKLDQEKEAMTRNDDYINYLRKTLGINRKDAKNILRTTGIECFDSGITKVEDIAAIENISQEDVTSWEEANKERLEKLEEEERNLLIQQKEEEARNHAMAMKKFSDRTPDLSKLGDKQRESYRKQFKKEMKSELKTRLIKQGETEEMAEKKANQMADNAADEIISGIIRFDDAKSKILEA